MNPKLKFFPYVIQIGSAPEVLYVNFASNIDQAFTKFLHRHPHLRHSILRPDLFDSSLYYSTSKKTNHACLRLINNLEADGFEVIAGGPLHNPYWQVYVIEINGDPQHLYVGETNYPVEKRFQQHVHKMKLHGCRYALPVVSVYCKHSLTKILVFLVSDVLSDN